MAAHSSVIGGRTDRAEAHQAGQLADQTGQSETRKSAQCSEQQCLLSRDYKGECTRPVAGGEKGHISHQSCKQDMRGIESLSCSQECWISH